MRTPWLFRGPAWCRLLMAASPLGIGQTNVLGGVQLRITGTAKADAIVITSVDGGIKVANGESEVTAKKFSDVMRTTDENIRYCMMVMITHGRHEVGHFGVGEIASLGFTLPGGNDTRSFALGPRYLRLTACLTVDRARPATHPQAD